MSKNLIQPRLASCFTTPLPLLSLLPSPLKPQLYHIPIKLTHTLLKLIHSMQYVYVVNKDWQFLFST